MWTYIYIPRHLYQYCIIIISIYSYKNDYVFGFKFWFNLKWNIFFFENTWMIKQNNVGSFITQCFYFFINIKSNLFFPRAKKKLKFLSFYFKLKFLIMLSSQHICFCYFWGFFVCYERNLIQGRWNQFKTTRQWLITRCFYYLLKTTLKCNIGLITYKCPLSLNKIYFIKMGYIFFMHAIPIHTKQKHTHFITAIQKKYKYIGFFFSFDFHRFKTDYVNFTILLSLYLLVA